MKLTKMYTQIDRESEEKRSTLIAEADSSEYLIYIEENSEEYRIGSQKLEEVQNFEYDPRYFEETALTSFNSSRSIEEIVKEELLRDAVKV